MAMSVDELLDEFAGMTLVQLVEFKKAFEERFEVTAAAPMGGMVMAAGPGGGAEPEADAEEQTEFDVVLTAAGDKKIQVIKEVRTLTSLGLKEAKDLVDAAPKPVKEGIKKDEADQIKAKIEAAGGTAEIK